MPDLDADTNEARSRDREELVEKRRSDTVHVRFHYLCLLNVLQCRDVARKCDQNVTRWYICMASAKAKFVRLPHV